MGKPTPEQARLRVVREFRTSIAKVVLFNEQVNGLLGLSSSESQTLHLLQLQGPMSPTELSRATGLSTGTVTGLVDTLVARGFARREPHPSDRRRVIVSVDHESLLALMRDSGDVYREQSAHLERAMSGLTIDQLIVVADFLAEINQGPAQLPEEFRSRLSRSRRS